MGLAWCPLVLEKKCELTTPYNCGSRNPSVSTEIKIFDAWDGIPSGSSFCAGQLTKFTILFGVVTGSRPVLSQSVFCVAFDAFGRDLVLILILITHV